MDKKYDLEERTEKFAKDVIRLCKGFPKTTINFKLIGQAISASGSVGANYIEANEALSKKDFNHRIKICRKEAKESGYWLRLILSANEVNEKETQRLTGEAAELMNIFGSIVRKTS